MEEKIVSRQKNVMQRIKSLEVGEAAVFPIEWMDTVRAQASKANALFGGRRKTHIETEERVIYVERSE